MTKILDELTLLVHGKENQEKSFKVFALKHEPPLFFITSLSTLSNWAFILLVIWLAFRGST